MISGIELEELRRHCQKAWSLDYGFLSIDVNNNKLYNQFEEVYERLRSALLAFSVNFYVY